MCKGDAEFTEAIHTNGNPLFGLGTADENGKNLALYGGVWARNRY
jgi:hypothetical protein